MTSSTPPPDSPACPQAGRAVDRSGPSRKAVILWTAVMFAVLGLAWFVGAWVVPVWRTREIVAACKEPYGDAWDKTCPDAVAALGGSERAARHLAIYVRLPDWVAPGKYEAFGILASCGRPAAPVLADNVKSPDRERRNLAVRALERLGADCEAAVPELIGALDDPSLRGPAALALSRTRSGRMAAVPVFLGYLPDRERPYDPRWNLSRMVQEDPEVARRLLREFHNLDRCVRAAMCMVFSTSGVDAGVAAVPEMILAMDDSESIVRRAAADGLGRLGPGANAAVSRLARALLEDNDEQTRRDCAAALGAIGDPQGRNALVRALKDSSYDVRGAAVAAVAKLGGPQAVETIMPALKDKLRPVRLRAVRSLGSLKARASASALVGMLTAEDNETKSAVVYALGEIGDPETVQALAAAAKNGNPQLRSLVATALGKIDSPRVVDPLVDLLRDTNNTTRHYAARSLGRTKDPRAITPLVEVLRGDDGSGRYEASIALGQIGEPAVGALQVALKDDAYEVREAAARALGITKSRRGIEPLKAVLKDPVPRVRTTAAKALEKIKAASIRSEQPAQQKAEE